MNERREIEYPPVGRCIYCGTDSGDLTREHVIAEALNGIHVLPQASCLECNKKTCRAETICLHQMFKARREVWKVRTKRPKKKRPTHLPIVITNQAGIDETVNTPISEHPGGVFLLGFPPPRLLEADFPRAAFEGIRVWANMDRTKADSLTSANLDMAVRMGSFNDLAFARMLAKMGHSHAVARRGLGSFTPLTTDLIREKTADYSQIVGCNPFPSARYPTLVRMGLKTHTSSGSTYLLAHIQIFANLGAPMFHVVVGKIESAQKE